MATAAFKSTTRRAPIGRSSDANDSSSSNNSQRRSRSLSRFSRRPPEPESDFGQAPAPRGRFVNTLRGSGFPEISLDDLAIEFFPLKDSADETESKRGRSSRRLSEVGHASAATASSQRRGRSVSRQISRVGDGKSNNFHNASGSVRTASDANSRRRRSVSVLRSQISDSESDIDHSLNSSNHDMKSFNGRNSQMPSSTVSNQRRLGRTLSQKDLSKMHEGYSSQSSALTDDEARDGRSRNMVEKTIRTVYAQKKVEHPTGIDVNSGLYEVMLKELRYAVDEIRTKLEQAVLEKTSLASDERLKSDSSAVPQAVSNIRKNYATKLEQSEKRKQDLLAELVLEEERGRELSKIVKELLPDPKGSICSTIAGKPSRARKRSNDRNRISKRLTEEAEKYFEDFISNVEDTDISSFDGERSDSSSTLGAMKARGVSRSGGTDTFQSTAVPNSLPVEIDGVILPWLQWETSNDGSPLPSKNKRELPLTPEYILRDAAREISAQDPSSYSASSGGSWSPGLDDLSLNNTAGGTGSRLGELVSHQRSEFDMDKYLKLQKEEDLLFEQWREQHRINSGGLLLCGSSSFII